MPLIPAGLTRTDDFSWPLPGTVVSWLTRRSAPSAADSASNWRSVAAYLGRVRSTPMLLSPQTIRSGRDSGQRAAAAELGGQRLRRVRGQARVADHARLHHGDRDLPDRGIGRGERERQRPGEDAGQPGGHAEAGQPPPPGGPRQDGRAHPRQGRQEEHDGHVGQHQHEADQPDAAHRGQREHGGMLPLADAEHRPRTAERLPGPQPFGQQPAARHHHQGGQRPRPAERGPQQFLGRHSERHPQHAEHRARPAARRDRSPAPSSTRPRSGSPPPATRRGPRPHARSAT